MPKLILTRADGENESVDLNAYETKLGRSLKNDVVLDSVAASRRHAVITVDARADFVFFVCVGGEPHTVVDLTQQNARQAA